jgi:hypothetical protein
MLNFVRCGLPANVINCNRKQFLNSFCRNWRHEVFWRGFADTSNTGPKTQKFRASHWLDTRYGLYESHIPTSTAEKFLIAASAALSALRDPERGDQVAALGDTTVLYYLYLGVNFEITKCSCILQAYFALCRMRDRMRVDPIGRQVTLLIPKGPDGRLIE